MEGSNDDDIQYLKKRDDVEDVEILKIRNKYRVHLTKDVRRLFDIDEGDRLIIVKDGPSECPYCKKSIKLAGNRMFIQKKGKYAMIMEIDKALTTGAIAHMNLSLK